MNSTETAQNVCEATIASAGRVYATKRLRALRACRNKLNKGKALFTDKGKTIPLSDPAQCASEYNTAVKLANAAKVLRTAVANPKKCTDMLVADLASRCAATIDGLIDATGTGGCLLTDDVTAADSLIGTVYWPSAGSRAVSVCRDTSIMTFAFDNTYARLPERFFARIAPTKVREPRLVKVNHPLAELLGLDPAQLDNADGAQILAGNVVPERAAAIAMAYAGHQFGGFVPQLGDGRAILLGEVVGVDGRRRDIQLKGAGPTPFSRGGDGRAALGPVLREYIVSEAMAAMGVPTTRALAAATTGESVVREELLPGAVLTRIAASHIRVGTFQFFAARDDRDALAILTAYALARHYARETGSSTNSDNDALQLLERVLEAQASLVARWLGVGFVHGVMNTDNTSISGETIDYGPCAFLDEYHPAKKFSSIDHGGRYAFANQPRIAQWNLARFAETLLPLISEHTAEAIRLTTERLERFPAIFDVAYTGVMRAKLGLLRQDEKDENDRALVADLLQRLASSGVDYTVFFRELCSAAEDPSADPHVASLFEEPLTFHTWAESWRRRLRNDEITPAARASAMRRVNPAFIPRNHRVEQAIVAAIGGDFEPFETMVRVLARPYDHQPEFAYLANPPLPEERVRATFCGT